MKSDILCLCITPVIGVCNFLYDTVIFNINVSEVIPTLNLTYKFINMKGIFFTILKNIRKSICHILTYVVHNTHDSRL